MRATLDGKPQPASLALRFQTLGSFAPTQVNMQPDGWVSFVFALEYLPRLSWSHFLDEFVGVIASCPAVSDTEWWIVPLHKNVLQSVNQTTLHAERLRDYSRTPRPDGRLAAFTIVYNEYTVLPLWAQYYGSQFGESNLYIIDQGSERPYGGLHPDINIIRLPRDAFDNWLIARVVAFFQRFLLESYDTVLYTDSDEFVCASPEVLAGRSLSDFLLRLPVPIGRPRGYNLVHDISRESAYDPSCPVLSQRRSVMRWRGGDKPLISRTPVSWLPGFHHASEGSVEIPGLYLLHLRYFDLDAALAKGGHYRASNWNRDDLDKGLGGHQLVGDAGIVSQFKDWSNLFASLSGVSFDGDAEAAFVPPWMRDAIVV
ncbi:MAG TPA: hypothetical protein VGM32_10120 [Rhodopila sp.]